MSLMQNAKGKRVERLAAEFLRSIGFESARRNMQSNGQRDGSEITCDELPQVHIEVKSNEAMDIGTQLLENAMQQAARDCKGKRPVVLWRRNRSVWRLTFDSTDYAASSHGDKPVVTLTVAGPDDIRHVLRWMQEQHP